MRTEEIPERYKIDIENNDTFIVIQGLNFSLEKDLTDKIVENIKKNVWLGKCKNCEKPFIINSPTHVICWRCKSAIGDVEL